ncbi:RyR domain-containing protein [Breoghania corrubedonensis]|uniref:RyR domain-containing protein n=1 Tax=Breoghania corrubedonensis TaxID=665038 RepID=A0A2T5UPY4_9HYPH|nr:RyR domain-containing protein [Breoghania corrubedonensis]PTW53552.1 RyR domain-containing protein [Breoghania corrubedonensis]
MSETPYRPDICIYRDKDIHSFAGAWVVHRRWADIEFRGCPDGATPPLECVDGRHVLIVGCQLSLYDLERMATRAASIIVLSRHKTGEGPLGRIRRLGYGQATWKKVGGVLADLASEPCGNLLSLGDFDTSSAHLAWNFCFLRERIPELVFDLEDNDLRLWRRKGSSLTLMYLRSAGFSFAEWDRLDRQYLLNPRGFRAQGLVVSQFVEHVVSQIAGAATVQAFVGYSGVPVAFTPHEFAGEVADRLLRTHRHAPFVVTVVRDRDEVWFHLRTAGRREDMGEIARRYGGDGSANEARFQADPMAAFSEIYWLLPQAPRLLKDAEVARVAHEVNRAYCAALGDDSQVGWAAAPEWQRSSAIAGVAYHRRNPTAAPSASHESWMAQKLADGWTYGEVKDPGAKTHPCLVRFADLPVEQRTKDYLFSAVVRALSDAVGTRTTADE